MKVFEQCFAVVLFIMQYKAVPTFQSVHEILKCNQLNAGYVT